MCVFVGLLIGTHGNHVWYIYLHVGKSTSPMDVWWEWLKWSLPASLKMRWRQELCMLQQNLHHPESVLVYLISRWWAIRTAELHPWKPLEVTFSSNLFFVWGSPFHRERSPTWIARCVWTSLKLTANATPLKMDGWPQKETIVFQPSIFGCFCC